jgi:hypothetical protein
MQPSFLPKNPQRKSPFERTRPRWKGNIKIDIEEIT